MRRTIKHLTTSCQKKRGEGEDISLFFKKRKRKMCLESVAMGVPEMSPEKHQSRLPVL